MGKILVAGGGIGGLAVALGLARQQRKVVVLERAPEFLEIGAGIQLGPNAFRCFDALGIGDAARALAIYVDRLRLMDAMSADEIVSIPLDEGFRRRFGNPYAVVHRGELHALMVRACVASPLIDLRPSAIVEEYDEIAGGVRVRIAGGGSIEGSALIGADGLWSNVRRQLVGDGSPRVSGHTTYRAVIPVEDMPLDLRWNAATLWAGPKCHIVHYPLSGWKLFNLVVTYHNEAPRPLAGEPVTDEEVQKGFEHVHPMARSIIAHGRDWKKWVLCDRDPIEHWSSGCVTLLGDAAHPMMQYMAQGACMAMEDAVVLADEIARHAEDIPAAFLAYQDRRRLRTARVQLLSREMGDHVYHPAGAHAMLRNAIMREKRAQDWYDILEWLYGANIREMDGVEGAVSQPTSSVRRLSPTSQEA